MLLNLIHLNIKDATQSMYLKDRGTLYFTDEQQATYLVNQHIDIIKSILQKIQTNPYVEVFIEQNVAKEINNNLFLIDNIENLRVYEPFKVDEKSQSYDDHVLEEHMIEKDKDEEKTTDKPEINNADYQKSNSEKSMNDQKETSDATNNDNLEQEPESVDENDESKETVQSDMSDSQIYEMISSLDSYENKNNIEQVGEMLSEQYMIRNANNNEYLAKAKRESILKGLLLYLFNQRHIKGVETDMAHAFNEININDILKETFKEKLNEYLHQMDTQDITYYICNNFYRSIKDLSLKENDLKIEKRN